mmetsp:Transcript_17138/g.27381  ORF Transcript_17138/g.27381 Transcript_17138/m.27381 type:complete len:484 (-) Transcript_17138:155-1606(-)
MSGSSSAGGGKPGHRDGRSGEFGSSSSKAHPPFTPPSEQQSSQSTPARGNSRRSSLWINKNTTPGKDEDDGWIRYFDDRSGLFYYAKVRWEKPEEDWVDHKDVPREENLAIGTPVFGADSQPMQRLQSGSGSKTCTPLSCRCMLIGVVAVVVVGMLLFNTLALNTIVYKWREHGFFENLDKDGNVPAPSQKTNSRKKTTPNIRNLDYPPQPSSFKLNHTPKPTPQPYYPSSPTPTPTPFPGKGKGPGAMVKAAISKCRDVITQRKRSILCALAIVEAAHFSRHHLRQFVSTKLLRKNGPKPAVIKENPRQENNRIDTATSPFDVQGKGNEKLLGMDEDLSSSPDSPEPTGTVYEPGVEEGGGEGRRHCTPPPSDPHRPHATAASEMQSNRLSRNPPHECSDGGIIDIEKSTRQMYSRGNSPEVEDVVDLANFCRSKNDSRPHRTPSSSRNRRKRKAKNNKTVKERSPQPGGWTRDEKLSRYVD